MVLDDVVSCVSYIPGCLCWWICVSCHDFGAPGPQVCSQRCTKTPNGPKKVVQGSKNGVLLQRFWSMCDLISTAIFSMFSEALLEAFVRVPDGHTPPKGGLGEDIPMLFSAEAADVRSMVSCRF